MTTQSSLAAEAMAKAAQYARFYFKDPDAIRDVVSVAWELAQSGQGNASMIALYAVRRVRSGRQFQQFRRDVMDWRDRWGDKPSRTEFDVNQISRPGDDPAKIARFRIDFRDWWQTLPPKIQRIAQLMATGEQTKEIARQMGVSPGRISQIRLELHRSWREFHQD